MKRILFFCVLVISFSSFNYSQWLVQQTNLTGIIGKVCFPNPLIGYVVDDYGHIGKTTDGGLSWVKKSTGFNYLIRGFCFTDSLTGYASSYGLIIKTTNGGDSWEQTYSNTNNYFLQAIHFPTSTVGYAVGDNGSIIKTTDGGDSWNPQNSTTMGDFEGVFFADSITGFATGTYNYQTTNGGLTWYHMQNIPNDTRGIYFVDAITGYIGGVWGEIFKTTNKGVSWKQQITPTSNTIYDFSFINNQLGYAVGLNGTILVTTNGGSNWQIQTSGTGYHLISVCFPSINRGFCCGGNDSPQGGILLGTMNGGFPKPIVQAVITADSLYYDSDFKGSVSTQVFGNNSTGDSLSFYWTINDSITFNETNPTISLHTGINKIKLTVTGPSEVSDSDSLFTNVVSSRNITGGAITSGVSQFGNNFYVTSMDKGVYEIDSVGHKLKTFLTGGSIQSVLTISPQGELFTGSSDTRLYAFDTALIPLWDKSTGGIINTAPAVSNDGSTVYCVTSSSNLFSYDKQKGDIKWYFPTDGVVTNSPVVFLDKENKDIIYAGTSNGVLYAIKDKGNSYELLWQKQLSDTIFSSVAIYPDGNNSMIYVGTKAGYLYRIQWDGVCNDDWKVNLNSPVYSSPVIDGNCSIFIGTKDGKLSGYSRDFTSSSVPFTSITLESGIIGTPAIGNNGNIYVGTEKGFLYSLDNSSQSLQIKWKANLYSSINSSALVTESGLVYIGTLKGDIFVLKEYSGETSSMAIASWPTFKGNNLRSKVLGVNSATGVNDNNAIITDYKLQQNYPNPFNPSTLIKFAIPQKSNVKLTIYNQLGEVVEVLVDREMGSGEYNFTWSPKNISSGVYFYQIKTNNFVSVKKAMFIK